MIDGFVSTEMVIALVIATCGGLMRGFAGVGSGMLMAPIFVILFGPVETIATIILMDGIATAQLLPEAQKHVDWRIVGIMGTAAAFFMPVGSWLLMSLDSELIARGVAGVVLVFSLILLVGWRYRGPRRLSTSLCIGAFSGVLIASTSVGNPPVMVYLLSGQDRAEVNRANFTGYFALTLLTLIIWMLIQGQISIAAVQRATILLIPFMIAVWIGGRLFRKSNESIYRRIALSLLLCVGFYGLVR